MKTFAKNGYFSQWESLDMVRQSPDKTKYVAVGTTKVSGKFIGRIILWNNEGQRLWTQSQKDMEFLKYVTWSKDNKYILASTDYGQTLLLDSNTGNPLNEFQAGLYEILKGSSIAGYNNPNYAEIVKKSQKEISDFLPHEKWEDQYLSSDRDSARTQYGDLEAFVPRSETSSKGIRIVNSNTRSFLPQSLERTDGPNFPRVLRFSPDGQTLAAGYDDGTVIVWNPTDGKELWRVKPHEGLIRALEWNQAGTAFASAAFDGCGWLRSECVAVTQTKVADHPVQIVWNRWFYAASALQWTAPDRLLITISSRAVEIEVKL